ncbi:hypothetical protein Nepgr_007262 [Nepenthes gracilis]|uniref:TIR domain-containing protein n=1 Tax=Nepenthes gracilis TaxID=150966 RepID=A0AAD3S6I8_NEPGR|nr:hypothetical protein Nepgr_007262 [Nepenthes gracilis]
MAKATEPRNPVIRSKEPGRPYDVFINHRGVDTKKKIVGLLANQLIDVGLTVFVDSKSMKAGDNLVDKIENGIRDCKVGVVVFSRRYCESRACLRELALMVDCKKKIIPIFWDVEPSELRLEDNGDFTAAEVQRFRGALREARRTIGLTFDPEKE